MNPFGDGSDGALSVAPSFWQYLTPNRKYQFTTVNIAAGGLLSSINNVNGSVLYICATDSIVIDGSLNVSGKANYGNNTWSVTLDGVTYTSPGVANGGNGGAVGGATAGIQSQGFGGGGTGGYAIGGVGIPVPSAKPGNGGNGSSTFGSVSPYVLANTNTPSALTQTSGGHGSGCAGGTGVAWAYYTRTGTAVYGVAAIGNQGGAGYGLNGADGGGDFNYESGAGSGTITYYGGGGGGAGGRAGRAGIHVVLKAPSITIGGTIITSGTDGQNGGNGGNSKVAASVAPGGQGGGGGGGGNGGNVSLVYSDTLSVAGTVTRTGGTGGTGGTTPNVGQTGINGTSGSTGSYSTTQVAPISNFTGAPTTGVRPLSVTFTNLSSGADSYLWNFGDGNTSTSTNPTHNYTTIGTFSVTLEATNEAGTTSFSRSSYITTTAAIYQRAATGTLLFGGAADRELLLYRAATGTLLLGGEVRNIILKDVDSIEEKRYLVKVYDPEGSFQDVWKDVISEPTFTQELNEIGSEMDLELARNSDSLGVSVEPLQTEAGTDITTEDGAPLLVSTKSKNQVGPGSSVVHNNRVDVWVFYGSVEPLQTEDGEDILTEDGEQILATIGAPNGRRIFTGFIADINSRYGNTETTLVKLISYGWDLEQYVVTDGDGKTTVSYFTDDPSDIAKDVIDKFVAQSTSEQLTYTNRSPTSISTSGTSVSYDFRNNTYGDALRKIIELMPSNWYFYVDLGDNLVYYRQQSSTPQHIFFLGKHIKVLDLNSSIQDATNRTLVTGGGVPQLYRDYTVAPAQYTRRKLRLYSDGRLESTVSADIIGDGINEENNKVKYRTAIEILSKQYDIESINVGDIVGFRNFGNYVDGLTMVVVGRTYTPDTVQLQLASKPPTINKRLEDIRRNLLVQENQNVPDEPV